ncbi:MAG TPA: S9 family peptidase [Vicinamibacterales bacterium]|nr:S9 family peptidase [Vicinamibacterales bacterium]
MLLRSVRRPLLAALICLTSAAAGAQPKLLTVEEVYSYDGWRKFNGSLAATMTWAPGGDPWLSDTHYLWPALSEGAARVDGPFLRVNAATGASSPLYTSAQVERALVRVGVASSEAAAASRQLPSIFSPARDAFLITVGDDLYSYNVSTESAARLTDARGVRSDATFSPDGRSVAFIKDNNIFVAGFSGTGERALTSDGNAQLLNGTLDWVYSEELYGRGNTRGYWWSPDSAHIAFLQLDEKPVSEYTLIDDLPYRPEIERWDYPKAGDPNPIARLGVISVASGSVRWIDTTTYTDLLIVNVGWTPDSRDVVYQIQNREQTWLDLNRAGADNGVPRRVLRETSQAWVERWLDASVNPIWLNDGSFLWLSERNGWRHFYHYAGDGTLIRQVTKGDWEIRRTHGIDASGTWAYFSSTTHSPIGLDLYRVRVDGTSLQRVSATAGRHEVFVNPSRTLFLDSWSDVSTPPQVRLHATTPQALVRVVDANPTPTLKAHGLGTPELMQVKTRDGFVMEAMMIKPPDFDPAKQYPVYQFTYAGPHAPQVMNGWGGTEFLYQQLLAQRGIIVWICDNRTASGKGMQSAWPLHKNFGALELQDIEDGVDWLKRQRYVDGERVGLAGVSFGAYMTLYALTHSDTFAMGIAEGAISDWRSYDTIYTERYMGLPETNPDGYRRSSPRFRAANLRGELLLVHSTLDDNVHPQHAMQMAYELQRAGKPFRMMMYPRAAHGVTDPQPAVHLRRMMLDFTVQNLLR